jgi:hypothetical protein
VAYEICVDLEEGKGEVSKNTEGFVVEMAGMRRTR